MRLLPKLILAAALLLAGCSRRIVVCPVPAILADTANVTYFRPGTMPDLANELYTVSLIDAEGDCVYSVKSGVVTSSLELTFRATRAPSSEVASYSVPYFVAVNENAKILAKHIYYLHVTFASGAATTTIVQSPNDISIKIENGKLPWNYQLMSGFQMTQAQIAYNKRKMRYLP